MLLDILPDLLRGFVTSICLICLFPVLSKPKYKPTTYCLLALSVAIVDTFINALFYTNKNYTGVVYYSLSTYIIFAIGCKFLFRDTLLQWCFNCVTVLNIYAIIVLSSYYLSGVLPYQEYAITAVRVVMFVAAIMLLYKYMRPLYLEISENWAAFVLPTVGILISYLYVMLSLGNVTASMSNNFAYFCILTLVTILTYIAIIFSLKSLKQKYQLREENIIRKAHESLLKNEIVAYEGFVNVAKQNRHDIRHHNAIIAEYLNANDIKGAKAYLKSYDDSIVGNTLKEFSKNPTANAIFRLYDRRAKEQGISFEVCLEVEAELCYTHIDIGILLSNLLENAFEACQRQDSPYVMFFCKAKEGIGLIEVKNSAVLQQVFENGMPISTKSGGGTGLLSVKNIVQKNNGMLEVGQEGNEFVVRIVLPLVPAKN